MSSIRYTVLLLVLFSFGAAAVTHMPAAPVKYNDCIDDNVLDEVVVAEQCVNCVFHGVIETSHAPDADRTPTFCDSSYERVFSHRVDAPDPFPPKQYTRS